MASTVAAVRGLEDGVIGQPDRTQGLEVCRGQRGWIGLETAEEAHHGANMGTEACCRGGGDQSTDVIATKGAGRDGAVQVRAESAVVAGRGIRAEQLPFADAPRVDPS